MSTTDVGRLAQSFESMLRYSPHVFSESFKQKLTKLSEENTSETLLSDAVNPLMIQIYLTSLHLLKNNLVYSAKNKIKMGAHLEDMIDNCLKLLQNPTDKKIVKKLKNLSNSDAFEFKKYHSWKHYPLITLDTLINGVNSLRGTLFQQDYSRSDLAKNNRMSPVLHHFLMHAPTSSTQILLHALVPASEEQTNEEAMLGYLGVEIKNRYTQWCKEHTNSPVNEEMKNLITSLNDFAKATVQAKEISTIYPMANKAFLSSQELVFSQLMKNKPSRQQLINLHLCFKQSALVITNPGDKTCVDKLKKLANLCDDKRFHCDKEKTTYAILHVIAAALLLALAVGETILSHGLNIAAHFWVLVAEGSSLLVGAGQLVYFSNSYEQPTLFASSFSDLIQATRLNSVIHINQRPSVAYFTQKISSRWCV